jgi:hypothetical protein
VPDVSLEEACYFNLIILIHVNGFLLSFNRLNVSLEDLRYIYMWFLSLEYALIKICRAPSVID